MPTTTNGLPYPAASETPDVPTSVQQLAEALNPYARAAIWGSYQRTTDQALTTSGVSYNVIGSQITMEGGLVLTSGTGEVTVPVAGLYLLNGWATFVANGTGVRLAYWLRNGVSEIRTQVPPTAGSAVMVPCVKFLRLAAGDKVVMQVHQTSGGTLNLDGSNRATGYDITRIAP